MPSYCLILALFLAASGLFAQRPALEDLDFLHGLNEYANIREMLPSYMQREAQALVDARKRSLDVGSPEALARRRQYVRDHLLAAIGGLPHRTPLNARVTAKLE